MSDNALQPAVVDVPLGSLNQLPPDHAGVTGRLVQLYDALITHYDSPAVTVTAATQKRVNIDPRRGFSSFSNVLRNSESGLVEAGTWASPSFLFALGEQLLSICTNRPRVLTGLDWTNYGDTRVVTQKLSQSVLHATNGTIAAPDHAWISGVTCSVWTEQSYATVSGASVLNTALWVGFRADDGAWVRVPTLRYTAVGTDNQYMLGKVVQDGSNFWVFYNAESSGHKIFIECYDLHGALVSSGNTTRNWTTSPGYWDVYGSVLAGVRLVQPASYTATQADVHVVVSSVALVTGSVAVTNGSTLTGVKCTGPVAWLTDDLTGTDLYLGTVGPAVFPDVAPKVKLWGYIIATNLTESAQLDVNESPAYMPDSLTGWAERGPVNIDSPPPFADNIYLSYSMLAPGGLTSGPTFDPATRFTKTVKCTFGNVTTTIRTTHSVIQQSRAFAIDGEYHAYTYYQSGSGQSLPSAPETVTLEEDDFFIGGKIQPLSFSSGGTYGGTPAATLNSIFTGQPALTGKAITGADTVQSTVSSGLGGLPDGTPVLKWTFANATPSVGHDGHILAVSSSSIPSANFQWDIYTTTAGGIFWTPTANRLGGTVTPGTFSATGTVDVNPVARFVLGNRDDISGPTVLDLFAPGGDVVVSGAGSPGNDGTFTLIARDPLLQNLDTADGFVSPVGSLWSILTTEVTANPVGGTAILEPAQPFTWFFGGEDFTEADQQSTLVVGSPVTNPVAPNNGPFDIITASSGPTVEVDHAQAAATIAQRFTPPMPSARLELQDPGAAFQLSTGTVTYDFTYIGALVSISNAAHASVNGVYTITALISPHVVRLSPTNGRADQRSETFINAPSSPDIVIQRSTFAQPQTQPTWFVTPLTGTQPEVGCFEGGLAFADWRFDSATSAAPDFDGQDRYRFALSSTSNPFGTIRQVVLPFRVSNFTQVSIATVGATPIDIANASIASTVGLKIFRSQGTGEGTGDAGKLLVPGLLAAEFTSSGFSENNFNVGPEAPFVVSEEEDSSTNFALTPGQTYTYQVVKATTLENGDVVRSKPSPPIQATLTGSNNVVNLGGRLDQPLGTDGLPVSKVFGQTNHAQTTYEIYRSVVVDGVPSTQLHMITNPGAPNARYTGTGTGSGFSFPDSFTWNYRDENPDAGVRATEVVYAGTLGQGIAPHFPAPPFSHATTWANRRWVVGYDGAVWMSAEIVEGEDTWFFPGFRYPFPAEDPAVCVVGFENFLFMFCAKSIWRIGLTELPNATLTSGSMPPPVRLPWAMGCSGFAVAMSDVVAYSSSVDDGRQVWAITRNLANVYLSESILDTFDAPVSGMAVDGKQRLLVLADDTKVRVYDPVSREWSPWRLPSAPTLIASYLGQPTYQDSGFVLQQSDSANVDTRDAVISRVAIDLTLSSLSFAAVRAVKRMWEAQILGTNNGDVNINAIVSYPFDPDETPPTTFGPTPIPNNGDLLLAINPAVEDAGEFVIRIFGSYEGIESPGRCFSLEMLSCEVGLDSKQGLRKLPDGFRLIGR